MTYPGMAFVFVVGVSLATILYYMFADSNNSHQNNAHGTNGSGPPSEIPHSWTRSNNTRPRQRRKGSNAIDVTNDCTICLNEIAVQHVSTQRCGHSFHKKCIQDWQQRGSMVTPTCPNCRTRIDKVY
ncbi:probable E3 ubiquitin-protein ligase XERICO [Chelonus insularis]|uniref:probable E3 ubiquitin-protein ligase XERICO n=1 Tax=Chelonus insularis TaxID=460826 RepID=UPI00158F1FBC|nr:probable E3 ubiquitin-protein ligase XERICO [Chelonus insularis]